MVKPSQTIQDAFLAPVVEIIRRVEIYEYDATTPWKQELWDDYLIDGGVTGSSDGDERRTFECTLDNSDGELDPEAGNLWYDKVFKVFYGLKLDQVERDPKVLIVEEYQSDGQALALKSAMNAGGVKYVHYNPLASSYKDLEGFDIIVSITSDYTRKLSLLTEAFNKGKAVFTCGKDATPAQLPYIVGSAGASLSTDVGIRSFDKAETLSDELSLGWGEWGINGPQSYRKINTASGGEIVGFTEDATNGQSRGIIRRAAFGGSRWMHIQQNRFEESVFAYGYDEFVKFTSRAVDWLDAYVPQATWETQIGEFVADQIEDADEWGDTIKVTARDYTSRCMESELAVATMHVAATPIEDIIRAHAANAGIRKFNLPITNKTLGKDQTWEGGTERWTLMKDIATANNYDLYFNAEGYLCLTPFNDPTLTPPTLVLTTGVNGNLISRGARTSAARLKNHVIVIGESSDSSAPPVWAELKNENENSPSNIQKLGDRVDRVTSSLVTTVQQAIELAKSLLSVAALEEFELDFSSVLFPWIEPGEIVEMYDPDSEYWGPSRYLLTSLTFPLDLSPMSGKGKRVINVG
jgi:hypothetical protein